MIQPIWAQTTFGPQQVITSVGATSVHAADLDGDGDMDVLSASASMWGSEIAWYENTDGTGRFGSQRVIARPHRAWSVYAADLDGDADTDVLSARSHGRIAWYKNTDGAGGFGPEQVITTAADGAFSVYAADLDGDGDTDVLSASRYDNKIAWYENADGAAGFGPQRVITTVTDHPRSVHAADLDGDGDTDALSASWYDDKIAWYENTDGAGNFGPQQVITTAADGAESVYTVDLDGDGDIDVLSASFIDDKIAWYENTDGTGGFGPQQVITTVADGAFSVYATDLDGDGDNDVLSASVWDDKIAWYENMDETGRFGPQQVITASAAGTWSVYAADLDGDGDTDVLSDSSSDNRISWYENLLYVLPPVKVWFPNGSNTFQGDSLIQIEWRTNVPSAGTGVRLGLWDSDGFITTLGYDWDPSGQHAATVYLPLVPEKDDYRVRVVSTFDPDLFDESDEPFTITGGAVKVHAPNGGETWRVNAHQPVHWQTSLPFAGNGVDIELWNGQGLVRDLGSSWDPDGEAIDRLFVPETIPNGDDYRVRVISAWAPELFDESDASFTILGGPVRNAVDARLWTLYR